ncbi:MAG: poly(A) polymerase [Gammaproteobacteria bacterium RIFCSPLOWO2_12_47_11]|nr:MAG: poly(A) polymerase [Gammaproteobacteria bacterium RIFCSPLOWO2_12_47_11]
MLNTDSKNKVSRLKFEPKIIPRSEHNISRSDISENALKVLYRLKTAGYKAYLVGGGVRDLLLNLKPKDFDVVTDARPEQIRELFRNCRLIGRRFRLAHIRYGNEIIEVSTFRAAHHVANGEGHIEDGRIIRDNVYGDIDDDAWRRDFTVNALFYNIEDFSIIDYVGGLNDIKTRQLRLIGNAEERYREDPVRMLRAVRFAAKLGFTLHPLTEQPLFELDNLLQDIPSARLFEEFMKLFMTGMALEIYHQLCRYGLFEHLFPETAHALAQDNEGYTHRLLDGVFANTDARIAEGKPVTPAFLIAALLWPSLVRLGEDYKSNGLAEMDAIQQASDAVISKQVSTIALPRRFTQVSREIWALQIRLKHRRGNRPLRLLSHPRFRAAYDFMLLRKQAGEELGDLAEWWTDFMEQNSHLLADPAAPTSIKTRRPRKRKRRFN